MKLARTTAVTASLALILTACGGGGSNSNAVAVAPTPTPTGTAGCAVSDQIAFADDVLNEWYLFPDLLDNTVNQADFTDVQSFLNARVAPARAQSRDVGFTFATSIAEENELISSGSSAGFGIRLVYDTVNNRVFGIEAFENGNGFQAGFDRGSELLAIGTDAGNLETVSSLMAAGGPSAVIDALGPSDPGVQRVLRFTTPGGATVEQSVTKTEFSLDPISDRYGSLILDDGGKKVGYLNLRTFIVSDAEDQLRDAFQLFASEGVTELIFDFRYNGGGLVRVAETLGDLMGQGRVGQVFSETVLRASKSAENTTELFQTEANAIQPTKIAVIATGSTASASELVTNSMIPYIASDSIALIGSDTSGKPVGQFGFDLAACDLRIRAVTFQTVNADGNGDYFTGLASVMPNTCRATDDIFRAFGDPAEASISRALDFLAGRTCTPITGTPGQQGAFSVGGREPLQPDRPSVAQYEMPGLF
ncbi:MAG: S41 family peptidase [Pseudomonadota bacterium]